MLLLLKVLKFELIQGLLRLSIEHAVSSRNHLISLQVSRPQGFIMHQHRRTTPIFRDKDRKCPILKHKLVRIKMDCPSLPHYGLPKGTEFAFQCICLGKSPSKCLVKTNDLLLKTQSFMLVEITRNYLFHHRLKLIAIIDNQVL